jgi:hypothetical protein
LRGGHCGERAGQFSLYTRLTSPTKRLARAQAVLFISFVFLFRDKIIVQIIVDTRIYSQRLAARRSHLIGLRSSGKSSIA